MIQKNCVVVRARFRVFVASLGYDEQYFNLSTIIIGYLNQSAASMQTKLVSEVAP